MANKDINSAHQHSLPWPAVEGIEPGDTLLTTQEVATHLRVTSQTLTKWRKDGEGPPFIRLGNAKRGRILYRWSDLRDWLEQFRTNGPESKGGD